MALNRRVHFLMDPEQYAALEGLARNRRKATGENTTLGTLLREAVDDYLVKHQEPTETRTRQRRSR
jgi:hypothetical protein